MGMAMKLNPPKRVDYAQAHGGGGGHDSGQYADADGGQDPEGDCGGGQKESLQHATRRIAAQREQFCEGQADRSADDRYENRFGQNDKQDEAVGESDRFHYREFAHAFADGQRHSVSSDQQQGEENHAPYGQDQQFDVASLLNPGRGHFRERFGFGFERRIGEHGVDGFDDPRGVVGGIKLHRVPAGLAFAEGASLLQILLLQPELGQVFAVARTVVDAANVEFPNAAVDRSLQWHPVANFPFEAIGGLLADDGTFAVVHKSLPLIIRNRQLGEDQALGVRINGETGEEILRVLVNPAEPALIGDVLHAGNPLNLVTVRKRQRLDDRDLVNDHQAVDADDVQASVEGAVNDGQETE